MGVRKQKKKKQNKTKTNTDAKERKETKAMLEKVSKTCAKVQATKARREQQSSTEIREKRTQDLVTVLKRRMMALDALSETIQRKIKKEKLKRQRKKRN